MRFTRNTLKTFKNRVIAGTLCSVLALIPVLSQTFAKPADAAEETTKLAFPTSFTSAAKPGNVVFYDDSKGNYNSDLTYKFSIPEEIRELAKNMDADNYERYGYLYSQVDYRVDSGSWHYTSDWDTDAYYAAYEGNNYYGFKPSSSLYEAESSYYTTKEFLYFGYDEYYQELPTDIAGCYTTTTSGSYNYYQFDINNHRVDIRVRFVLNYTDGDGNDQFVATDWSDTASYGRGITSGYTVPSAMDAPILTLDHVQESEDGDYDYIYLNHEMPASVVKQMCYPENFSTTYDISWVDMNYEAGVMDPITKIIDWQEDYSSSYPYNDSRYFSLYGLYYDRLYPGFNETNHGSAYHWDGEDVYVRAYYEMSIRVYSDEENYDYQTIKSSYSNVLQIEVPETKCYKYNFTYGDYADSYYCVNGPKWYTEGTNLGSFNAYPIEGCWVDTVVVDGVTMYDSEDSTTYELLDWYTWGEEVEKDERKYFSFLSDDPLDTVTKDVEIEITYAGTPTAQHTITTTKSDGGSMYPFNSEGVLAYEGTAKTFEIEADAAYVIDKLTVDGSVISEASGLTDYEYTFTGINSPHTIDVTFKKIYNVIWVNWSSNGTVTTSDGSESPYGNHYITPGENFTVTFTPNEGEDGVDYSVEYVEIDNTRYTDITGSYTFENVNADHSIYIKFTDTPVTTHDITVTSNNGGTTSPNGVGHAIEGGSYTADFYPDEGYRVKQITVDGTVYKREQLASNSWTFSNVTAAHTIYVEFELIEAEYDYVVTITKIGQADNMLSPDGAVPVNAGDNLTITYTAYENNLIDKIEIDGVKYTGDLNGTLLLENIQKNTTVVVTFEKYHALGDVDGDGGVKINDAQLALQYALKIITLRPVESIAADVNQDGTVALADAQLILKAALKIITSFD